MKIAFIHQDKKLHTGAHYINNLISQKLKENGVRVKHFYPRAPLVDAPHHLKGLNNILFFHSLLERKDEILKCDIIQGTTYTPLAYLPFDIPVISHCGSTTRGFLKSAPLTHLFNKQMLAIWHELRKIGATKELNIKTRRPLRDIAEIEEYVAQRAEAVIATSKIVADELVESGTAKEKVHIIHNAIEDFWFQNSASGNSSAPPSLVYLGRLGRDVFTLKLKGFDRLVWLYRKYPKVAKMTIAMTTNARLIEWFSSAIPEHTMYVNLLKTAIYEKLKNMRGSILIVPSRYEGFCLSMIEGMSQGLVPIAFPVGVAPEIIENGVNGFLVNSENEMKESVDKLLSNNELRLNMAREAAKTARKFRADSMAKSLISLYNSLLR